MTLYTAFDVQLDDFSELPDTHTLDIEIFGPYEQIFDDLQGYLSELPDTHTLDIETSGPYEQISDGLKSDFFQQFYICTLGIEMFSFHEIAGCVA